MASVEEIDEITSLLKAIKDVQEERDSLRIQQELIDQETEILSKTVQVQRANIEKQKQLLESLKGVENREKDKNAAILACKRLLARGSFQPFLWFAEAQVQKSKNLYELNRIEKEKEYQKLIDDYTDKNPHYKELKQKQTQLVKLQDDLKKKEEETIRFQNVAAEEKAIENMMLQENIIDLARTMVQYNTNFPKAAPESTSAVQQNIPMDEDSHHEKFQKCTISSESVDAKVNDNSDFKLPPQIRAVKRKPIKTSETTGFNNKADNKAQSRAMSLGEKFKLPTAARTTKETRKSRSHVGDPDNRFPSMNSFEAPFQLRSILKHKEVKTMKKPIAEATVKPLQDKRNIIQKNIIHVVGNRDSNLSSPPEHSIKPKSKTKMVKFMGLDSSMSSAIESDIISLSEASQNDSTSNSKSASNIDIGMGSSNRSDGSAIETNEENISKHQFFDVDVDQSSNTYSIQQNMPKSQSIDENFKTTKQANVLFSPNLSFDLNFDDPNLFDQFTTPKSKPLTAAPTGATLDSGNDYPFFDYDFRQSSSQGSLIRSTQSTTQTTSGDTFDINFDEADNGFANFFK